MERPIMTYVFYSKLDSNREIIGRVMATSLNEAREMISERKALSEILIDELYVIETLEDHENHI
jgi:hypothetical protein